MATTPIITDNPVYQEDHYAVAPTTRLDTTPDWLPRDVRPLVCLACLVIGLMLAGVAFRAQLFSAGFSAGWAARQAIGGVWDERGWAALVVFSIAGTSAMIYRSNRIAATCTPPRND